MKSFICSLLTLTVLTAAVLINCSYVKNCTAELLALAEKLPQDAAAADVSLLKEEWDKNKKWISLSVDHKETDEIDDTLSKLATYAQLDAGALFSAELTALKCQLQCLAESESFSLDRVF